MLLGFKNKSKLAMGANIGKNEKRRKLFILLFILLFFKSYRQ